jgi:membrane-bound lytic murein transglycosylase D
VPKLQAVKNIVSTPESFRITLPNINNHPYFQSVNIKRDMDVALVAKLAEVPLEDFKALNPSANKPVLLASGTAQILLPWDNAERFQANLEAYTGGQLASWTAWAAPATLKPADAAKRVGMTEAELRAVNNIPARMLIRAGSTLLVRRAAGVNIDVALHIADNGQLSLAPEVVLKKTIVKAGRRDSVPILAKRYAVSADSIANWNKLSPTASLKFGQAVVLYLPGKISGGKQVKSRAVANRKVAHKPKPSR